VLEPTTRKQQQAQKKHVRILQNERKKAAPVVVQFRPCFVVYFLLILLRSNPFHAIFPVYGVSAVKEERGRSQQKKMSLIEYIRFLWSKWS
jgi:hypothetical protein